MSNQYVGEIRSVGFNFAPAGWFLCQGQTLAIANYEVLFNLLGTTYGGNGTTTFLLPNLCGRTPIHQGVGGGGTYVQGQIGGTESVTLLISQIPAHTHSISVQPGAGSATTPANNFLAGSNDGQYAASGTGQTGAFSSIGGSIAHSNLQPYLTVNYIIAWTGIFPTRS